MKCYLTVIHSKLHVCFVVMFFIVINYYYYVIHDQYIR